MAGHLDVSRHRIGPSGGNDIIEERWRYILSYIIYHISYIIWVSEILAFSASPGWPGLDPEDVRATYTIVMTGPGTAMLEFIDGARTLREVRSGPDTSLVSSRLFFSKGQLSRDGRAWEMY